MDRGTYTMLSHKLHLDPFCSQTSPQLFLLCHQMKTHEKISWWVFSTCLQRWELCVNKNVHLVMQHPSLGSMTKRSTDTPEILILMPKPGQEPSIYIYLSPFKIADFMHPKCEGCIVINSPIFVVVSKNILCCLNLGKNYLWTKSSSNKKKR